EADPAAAGAGPFAAAAAPPPAARHDADPLGTGRRAANAGAARCRRATDDAGRGARSLAAGAHRDAEPLRLDRAQGWAHRRSLAGQISRDGRSDLAADRAARAVRQPEPVLRRIRLVRA